MRHGHLTIKNTEFRKPGAYLSLIDADKLFKP